MQLPPKFRIFCLPPPPKIPHVTFSTPPSTMTTTDLFSSLCVCVCVCVHAQSLNHVQLFATPRTAAHQAPLSMGFPSQESWSGLPFPSPRGLPDPGIEPTPPALAGGFFTSEPPRKPFLPYRSPFFRMSYGWKHTVCAFESGFFHSARCLLTTESYFGYRCASEIWDVEVCLSNFLGEGQ